MNLCCCCCCCCCCCLEEEELEEFELRMLAKSAFFMDQRAPLMASPRRPRAVSASPASILLRYKWFQREERLINKPQISYLLAVAIVGTNLTGDPGG